MKCTGARARVTTATRRQSRISDETGGRLIDVGNNGAKLQAAFEEIEAELRTQYVASYTSSNTKAGRRLPAHRGRSAPATTVTI